MITAFQNIAGIIAIVAGLAFLTLVIVIARAMIQDARGRRESDRRAAEAARLGAYWPRETYYTGTTRGTGYECSPVETTWPEVCLWAETASTWYGVDTAFVMQSTGPGLVSRWEWAAGEMTGHEVRKAARS